MSDRLPPLIESFIREQIGSVVELELLLLLARDPNQTWTADSAAKVLYVAADAIRTSLERFRVQGLCELVDTAYRFSPKTTELAELVVAVGESYQQRRLTVINLIYTGPVDKFQRFADAFRFRRPE